MFIMLSCDLQLLPIHQKCFTAQYRAEWFWKKYLIWILLTDHTLINDIRRIDNLYIIIVIFIEKYINMNDGVIWTKQRCILKSVEEDV